LLFFDEAGAFFSHEISPRPSKFEALNFSKAHGLSRSVFRRSRSGETAAHKWRCGFLCLASAFSTRFLARTDLVQVEKGPWKVFFYLPAVFIGNLP
jgi:hypothetical protein